MRQTDLDISPYHDDYDPLKRFHQVLFKAGYTVQARELNEIQDILMGQVESMGSHLFKNGSVVIPGTFSLKTDLYSLKLAATQSASYLGSENLRVRGATTGVEAKVLTVVVPTGTETHTFLFVDVDKSGDDTVTPQFDIGEPLVIFDKVDNGSEIAIETTPLVSAGVGTEASVDQGIYFIRGMMVLCESQSLVVGTETEPSLEVGFVITEEIITSDDDEDLLSGALGQPNFRAPGADRLRLTLTLGTATLGTENTNFLSLASIDAGKVEKLITDVQYNELERVLAQRTFEESGNYSVNNPQFEIREHLNDGTNGGVYTPAQGGDADKLVCVISPAVHYVKGYRIENSEPRFVSFPKSRDTAVANNASTASSFGSYFDLWKVAGIPFIDPNVVYSLTNDAGTVIYGTCRAFTYIKIGTNAGYLVVRDIQLNSGVTWNVATRITATKGANTFSAFLHTKGVLGGGDPSLILPLPYTGVRSLQSEGETDTNYQIALDFNLQLDGSGSGLITAPSGTTFTGNFAQYQLSLADGSAYEINGAGYSLVGTPVGSGLQVNAGSSYANMSVRCAATLQKSVSAPRTKKKTVTTDTINVNGTDKTYTLANADVLRLISVSQLGNDLTAQCTFDGGQGDHSYNQGTITSSVNFNPGQITVEYEYYAHGPGDYFAVDSYIDTDYEEIPSYTDSTGNEFNLRDCLDFRKTYVNGIYTGGSLTNQNSSVIADIEFYLPRFASIFVNSDGLFSAQPGISSAAADIPKIPENAMRLADVFMPPYTLTTDEVVLFPENNIRFTMRDIGKLEQRIENVEYYTALSQLEVEANNIQVIDSVTGNDRFKNGIIADQFVDFRLMNPEDEETMASIDDAQSRLRPMVESVGLQMGWLSGGRVSNEMISATTNAPVVFINQPFATRKINVNPYAVFSWAGFINLSPSRDFWVDTVYKPNKVVNITQNTRGSAREGVVYGKWSRLNNGSMAFRFNQQRSVSRTSFTEWTTSRTDEKILKTELVPYMRSTTVRFTASGLRPFTRVYPWFSNKLVSAYCRPDGGVNGDPLVTDASGNVRGYYTIPNNNTVRFSCGSTSFVLTDSAVSVDDPNVRTTFATAQFEAGGRVNTAQRTTTQTRVLGVTRRTEIEYRQVDPVAQSFVVEQAGGLFLEKVGLFFASKSKTIPVTVEIRAMENGLPTHEVVARTVLEPASVSVSSNASIETAVPFAPLVYLEEGKEYAVVVLANTQEYEVYISQMGERVLGSTQTVSVQPVTGVFFTSSNGSTWSPQQLQDLKFKLYRSSFNTSTQYVTLRPSLNAQGKLLGNNPIETVSGDSIVTVYIPAHGCNVGDNITLSGLLAGSGYSSTQLNKSHQVIEVVGFGAVKINLLANATSAGRIGGSNGFVVARNLLDVFHITADHSIYEGTSLKFEVRYRAAAGRSMSSWMGVTPDTDLLLPFEGSYYESGDLEVRLTINATETLSPQIDIHGFTSMLNALFIDQTEEWMSYVSRDIYLNNPSTGGRFFISGLFPNLSNMKFYVRLIRDNIGFWEEIEPTAPIVNGSADFTEVEFDLPDFNEFIGMRFKVVLTGSRENAPVLKDIRGVILA